MRIYLDTNVFIAAVEGWDDHERYQALWQLFSVSEKHGSILITSALSIAELLVKPLTLNLEALAATYIDLLQPGTRYGLNVLPIDQDVLIGAAHIRRDDKTIKLPDAIHVATAERSECDVILTADQRLTSKRPRLCQPITTGVIDALIAEVGA
jgi:predicted nucleic acid-binding protein